MAQDPVQVDSDHYKVEFENDQVRVLRVRYNPHEKSVMHDHPAAVGVHLTDMRARFTFPDGSTEDVVGKAGEARLYPAGEHLPENMGDNSLELVLVELKNKST